MAEAWTVPGLDALLAVSQRALGGWLQSGAAAFEGATWAFRDISLLVSTRIQADLEAVNSITTCRGPLEWTRLQRQFVERATVDYFDSAQRLTSRYVTAGAIIAGAFLWPRAPES